MVHTRSNGQSYACTPPAQQVTWFQAVRFCNWLSQLHGLEPYYEKVAAVHLSDARGQSITFENWVGRPAATGYRLPTEAEFEYACRAIARALFLRQRYAFFESYAAWSNNTTIPASPCGGLIPNPSGDSSKCMATFGNGAKTGIRTLNRLPPCKIRCVAHPLCKVAVSPRGRHLYFHRLSGLRQPRWLHAG